MKALMICIALTVAMATALAAQPQAASITFAQTGHDFGTIQEEAGIVAWDFEISNPSPTPLIIHRVATTCTCVRAEWPKEPLAPGARGAITIRFDPRNRPGPFSFNSTVFTNASEAGFVLGIQGRVTPRQKTAQELFRRRMGDLGLITTNISFSRITATRVSADTARVFNFGPEPLTLGFARVPHYLSIRLEPQTLMPQQEGRLIIAYDASQRNEWGFVTDRVELLPNGQRVQGNLITITASIEEDFSQLTPAQLAQAPAVRFEELYKDFGQVAEGVTVEHEFRFTNTGRSDLIIRSIRASCGCTTAAPENPVIKPGESNSLRASFRTSGFRGKQSKSITVITNDPNRPTTVLRLTGHVVEPK